MMPFGVAIIDLPNENKLIRGLACMQKEGNCFDCHKREYITWAYMTRILPKDFTILPICEVCVKKVASLAQKGELDPLPSKGQDGGRFVDIK